MKINRTVAKFDNGNITRTTLKNFNNKAHALAYGKKIFANLKTPLISYSVGYDFELKTFVLIYVTDKTSKRTISLEHIKPTVDYYMTESHILA